jgi:hypothetical protein
LLLKREPTRVITNRIAIITFIINPNTLLIPIGSSRLLNEYTIPIIEVSPISNPIIPINKPVTLSPNTAQIKNINEIIDITPKENATFEFVR